MDWDSRIRQRAITHVEALALRHAEVVPASELAKGFEIDGQRVHLLTRARGIFTPAGKTMLGALSVKTTVPRRGRQAAYEDLAKPHLGLFDYRFQGTDPANRDNQLVRACLVHRLPILYFWGVAPGRYRPIICFVVGEDTRSLSFQLAPVSQVDVASTPILLAAAMRPAPPDPQTAVYEAKRRLGQDRFREAILAAYKSRCAICRLGHVALLDAAHITPFHAAGPSDVSNGLALCKLHHAAYDAEVLGVTADYVVKIAPTVLIERDGPLLKHGIQEMHDTRLTLPFRPSDRPDRDRLAERWGSLEWA